MSTVSTRETFEDVHRERKRSVEMSRAMDNITPFLANQSGRRILEFGSGEGYQIPYFWRLGNFVASDIYKSQRIERLYPEVEFIICDIRKTPFAPKSFDFIFSNHVIEHIKDTKEAFSELKRIGGDNCIYAFTVPTATWLMLSVPAQYYNGMRKVFGRKPEKDVGLNRSREDKTRFRPWQTFLPRGHGWRKDFFACLDSFRIKSWENLFSAGGFKILKKAPLLLYAPSEFPIVPTTDFLAGLGISSSAIFIMRKG